MPPSHDMRFDARTHTYWHGDIQVPGATSILKNCGLVDDRWFTEESAEKGNRVHKVIENYVSFGLDSAPEDLAGYLEAYKKFEKSEPFKVEASELLLFHSQLFYAGTGDLFGEYDGDLTYIDVKSGVKCREHAWQSAGYAEAFRHETGRNVKRRFGLHLRADGKYSLVPHNGISDLAIFLAAATVEKAKRGLI